MRNTRIAPLAKSRDSRTLPIFISVLQATAGDPKQYVVSLNALHGIQDCGVQSGHRDEALDAIRKTAIVGCDEIRREAQKYLKHYEAVTRKK